MTYDSDESTVERTEVWQALEDARHALNEYQHILSTAIARGRNPRRDERVQQSRLKLHTATMAAYTTTRPYLVDLAEYWDQYEIDPENGLIGFAALEDYQLAWDEWQERVEQRHGEAEMVTRRQMRWLTNTGYTQAIHGMRKAALEDGFAPQPQERDIEATEILT